MYFDKTPNQTRDRKEVGITINITIQKGMLHLLFARKETIGRCNFITPVAAATRGPYQDRQIDRLQGRPKKLAHQRNAFPGLPISPLSESRNCFTTQKSDPNTGRLFSLWFPLFSFIH